MRRVRLAVAACAGIALISAVRPVLAAGVPRNECFPLEQLAQPLRGRSEALLLHALDTEALYTLIGDLKPLSSLAEITLPVDRRETLDLEELRRATAAWHCGDDYSALVHHFVESRDGRVGYEGQVWNRAALAALLARHASLFARFGITAGLHPDAVMRAVDRIPMPERARAYGFLYGYPDYAIDFFLAAGQQEHDSGQRTPTDTVSVPTYARSTGLYVWSVSKGHVENAADRQIRKEAVVILQDYLSRRPRYIGPGKPGVVALLRDWLDDGTGRCSATNVKYGKD
jgi:hypothetical protein